MPKIKKIMILLSILLSACLGALICFFTLSALDKIETKKDLVIEINDVSTPYTGSPIYANSYNISKGSLSSNDYIDIEYTTSQTYVGVGVADADVNIYSKDNVNVTKNYNLKVKAGKITVSKKTIILDPVKEVSIDEDITKCNLFNIVSGEIGSNERIIPYAVGTIDRSSENVDVECKILNTEGIDVTSNYDISLSAPVKLEKAPLVITTKSASKVYDGTALQNTDYQIDGLYDEDRVEVLNYTSITNYVDSGITNTLTTSDIEVLDSDGNDVKGYYNIIFNNVGILTIQKKKIKIESASLDETYTGEDFIDEVKDFTTSDINLKDTIKNYVEFSNDSIINAGTYTNKISIKENAITSNYDFEIEYGDINISKCEVTLETASFNKTYDGTDFILEAKNYTLSDTSNALLNNALNTSITYTNDSIINAGTYTNKIVILENEVLNNYDINVEFGTINILKKKVSLVTASLNKTYDGKDSIEVVKSYTLSDGTDEVLKVALNNAITYTNTSLKNAGSYINRITISDNEVLNNYDISVEYGVINIYKYTLIVTLPTINISVENTSGDVNDLFDRNNIVVSNQDLDDASDVKYAINLDIKYDTFNTAGTYTYSGYLTETFDNLEIIIMPGTINVTA